MDRTFVYEPKTEGKLVLHTSGGDVNIALWPKAAPKACRNFLQLSADVFVSNKGLLRRLAVPSRFAGQTRFPF
ncbi:hypothetical protein MHBO_001505 [Bonamia ostreae]|uniref:PPIase cyclophilin-type domain-containing protein n=1 Tax=Bonamia ostreae TaxID=126728 RepID=A0ABV2AJ86_9EUKA